MGEDAQGEGGSDDGGPAGAGAGAGMSDCDSGRSGSPSSQPRHRLPSHKILHGYRSSDASNSDSDSFSTTDNTLAVDTSFMGVPHSEHKAAVRSHAIRHTTSVRGLPARVLFRLLQCVAALVIAFLERWAPRDPGGLYWSVRARLDKRYSDDRSAGDDDTTTARLLSAASTALQALPPRSRESRAIRAVLGAAGRRTLEAGLAEAEALGRRVDRDSSEGSNASDTDDSSEAGDTSPPTLTAHAYRRARSHYRLLTCGSTLDRKSGARRSRSDAAVQSVVDFMYRNDNTTTLSWGSTRVKVGGKVEVIQARNRLQSLGRLWAGYDREMVAAGVRLQDRVRRTMFYELGGAITARDLKVGGWQGWGEGCGHARGGGLGSKNCPLAPALRRISPLGVAKQGHARGEQARPPVLAHPHVCMSLLATNVRLVPQARGTCDAKVLEYGAGAFVKLRGLVVAVFGPQNAAVAGDPTTAFLDRIDLAQRFLKFEFKSHIMQVGGAQSSIAQSFVLATSMLLLRRMGTCACGAWADTGGPPHPWSALLLP